MVPPKLQSQFAHSTVLRYGLAASSSAVALGLALLAQQHGFRNEEVPVFLFAIAVTVWYARIGPAILAVVLSSLSFDYFFTEPRYSFYVTSSELSHYAVFVLFALLLTWFATVRRRVEADLRQARDELEIERKAVEEALRQNKTYLSEAQRLSNTGSFGWKPSTRELIWSEETFRIFQYDLGTTPTVELVLQRVHPEDVTLVQQTIERATKDEKDFEHEYRLLMPDGSLRHLHVVARALSNDESGAVEFVGAVMDVTERERAAEALLRTEAYLAEGQKLSHTGTWACNIATREMIHSSEEHRRLFGLVPGRAGIPPFEEFYQRIHPDDRGPTVGDLERAIVEKSDAEAHFRVVRPDGTTRYMYGIGRPLVRPSGETGEYVGTLMDVSERKLAEEALRQSESYLAEAQRLSHTGSGAWRVPEGDALYLSEEWFRIYGFDPKQGLSAWNDRLPRMHPEDQAKVAEAKDRAIREKSDYGVDHRIVLPDGTVKYTHTVGHPVLNASGEVVQFVCTMMDVTERKRAEEKLRQSEAYLAEAQKLTHTGSWVWDVVKRCALHISEEWYCIYGFDPGEGMLTWEKREDRIHPDDRVGQLQAIERAIKEKSDYDIEYRILLPNGAVRHLHSVGHPVMDASGNLVQFAGSSTDITERRQAEEALRQARSDLARISRITTMGELTASLAHEVNQPIAAAVTDADTCLRWLSRDQPDLDEAREAASRMMKDATRAADIIRRIRLLFKKGSPQREFVDINEVVREMVVLLQSEATPFSVSIQTELGEIPQVMADRVQLQQVLMNLVINAIDAMKDVNGPRELIIRSQQAEDGQVMVSTCDTGMGLPPQQADRIFDAFFTTKPHGTGMGLSISRSIVESHGGRLWAAHNSGRGASFYFTLPSAGAAEQVA
jgi:PAS domain S-box-containing protein